MVKLAQISPNIRTPIHRKHTSFSPPVTIRKSHNIVIPHATHEENNVCLQIIYKITTSPYFLNSPEAETTI